MLKAIGRAMVAVGVGASSAVAIGGGDFTISVVNPDNSQPVANQQIRVDPKGEKARTVMTDENGKLNLPSTFIHKSATLRCGSIPLLFNTHQNLESGITVVLKHHCGPKGEHQR